MKGYLRFLFFHLNNPVSACTHSWYYISIITNCLKFCFLFVFFFLIGSILKIVCFCADLHFVSTSIAHSSRLSFALIRPMLMQNIKCASCSCVDPSNRTPVIIALLLYALPANLTLYSSISFELYDVFFSSLSSNCCSFFFYSFNVYLHTRQASNSNESTLDFLWLCVGCPQRMCARHPFEKSPFCMFHFELHPTKYCIHSFARSLVRIYTN